MPTIQDLERQVERAPTCLALARALNELAWELRQVDSHRSLHLAQRAESLVSSDAEGADAIELAKSVRAQASTMALLGNHRDALEMAERGLAMPIMRTLPEERFDLLVSGAWCQGVCGDYVGSIEVMHQAVALAIEIGSEVRQARALAALGAIYGMAEDTRSAIECIETALALDALRTNLRDRALLLNNLAVAYLESGLLDEAYAAASECLTLASRPESQAQLEATLDTLGEICLRRGQYDEALGHLNRAISSARHSLVKTHLCDALLHRSQAYLGLGYLRAAKASAVEGLELAHSIEASHTHYALHKALADILAAQGNASAALVQFRLYHEAKGELLSQEARSKLHDLRVSYALQTARRDAEIHQLRNVELEQEIAKRRRAEQDLRETLNKLLTALNEVRMLSGMAPICTSCQRVRSDEGYWQSVEQYIVTRTDAQLSHGICPECRAKLYAEWGWDTQDQGPDRPER